MDEEKKIKFAAVRNHESKKKKMNKLRKILSEVSFFLGNPVRRNIDFPRHLILNLLRIRHYKKLLLCIHISGIHRSSPF